MAALAAIEEAGLSTALFAPGWIFEDEQFQKEDFDANYTKFWSQFEGKGLQPQPLVGLPLVTSFSSGTGTTFAIDGAVVASEPNQLPLNWSHTHVICDLQW